MCNRLMLPWLIFMKSFSLWLQHSLSNSLNFYEFSIRCFCFVPHFRFQSIYLKDIYCVLFGEMCDLCKLFGFFKSQSDNWNIKNILQNENRSRIFRVKWEQKQRRRRRIKKKRMQIETIFAQVRNRKSYYLV